MKSLKQYKKMARVNVFKTALSVKINKQTSKRIYVQSDHKVQLSKIHLFQNKKLVAFSFKLTTKTNR